MAAERQIENIQAVLQRCFRSAGRGSVREVQDQLHLGAGYFKNQRRAGQRRVDLKVLLRALDQLSIDPADFFATALGVADPVEAFRADAQRRQVKLLPTILALAAQRMPRADATVDLDLDALDALRSEDPRKLIQRVKALISDVTDVQLPTLLGIYASACRAQGKLDEAQVVLARALDLAQGGDGVVFADLIQRASYVVVYRGDFSDALALSRRASLYFAGCGELVGIGKTLVDQGMWLAQLDQPDEALQLLRSALAYLPEESDRSEVQRNRFSCLMSLGVIYQQIGDLARARRFAEFARRSSEGIGRSLIGKLLALQGSIAREMKRYDEAESFFSQAFETFRTTGPPIDAALSSVELVKVQLLRGRAAQAYETARAMTVLLQSLQRNRLAAAAVTELIRCALAGRGLTIALVDQIAGDLDQGRRSSATASSVTASSVTVASRV